MSTQHHMDMIAHDRIDPNTLAALSIEKTVDKNNKRSSNQPRRCS